MSVALEAAQVRLLAVLDAFAEAIASIDPGVSTHVGATSSDAYALRAYLSIQRHADGDEVAVTIDAWKDGQQLHAEMDVCRDNGEVLLTGPRETIAVVGEKLLDDVDANQWIRSTQIFLDENHDAVSSLVSTLD